MVQKTSGLDAVFIQKQQERLIRLRRAVITAAQGSERDEATLNEESAGGPREPEDDAQRLAALELDGARVVHDIERLARIDRALAKIEAGTYGLSEVSGQLIARERLEAVPEAICTLAEERDVENDG
jgi:DnaK suppressor protein